MAAVLGLQFWQANQASKAVNEKPGSAYVETFKCARGLNRIVLMGGREDGFDQSNPEPARLNPARLPNPYLETIRDAQNGMLTLRDYDEGGQDKVLIDYFNVPRGLVTAQLVVVQRPIGSQTYDGLKFGDLQNLKVTGGADPYFGFPAFNYSLGTNKLPPMKDDKRTGLLVLDMAAPAFVSGSTNESLTGAEGSVLDYLNLPSRPDVLDIQIQDDTAIDFVAFVACQTPPVAMGTTFSEASTKPYGPEVSMLSCNGDQTQQPCNPFQGDQACSQVLPLACYKPSNAQAPAVVGATRLKSGEVRPSLPVAASQFSDLASANAFCANQFGADWRVLAYHDSINGLSTISQIAPKTRLWIDVRSEQYGNCWDRDKPRLKQ